MIKLSNALFACLVTGIILFAIYDFSYGDGQFFNMAFDCFKRILALIQQGLVKLSELLKNYQVTGPEI